MSLDMDDVDKTYKNIAALREMQHSACCRPTSIRAGSSSPSRATRSASGWARFAASAPRPPRRLSRCARSGGPFKNLMDFCTARRQPVDQSARARSADQMRRVRFRPRQPRAPLMAQVEDALKIAQQRRRATRQRIRSDCSALPRARRLPPPPRESGRRMGSQRDAAQLEKETLGFYITAHPLDKYDRELRRRRQADRPPI